MKKEDIQSLDSQDMWNKLVSFPSQWEEAMERSARLDLTIDRDRIKRICLVGMGGSSMAAEIIRAYVYDSCPWPIEIVRHYKVPAWINDETLVVATSFSGNTEETLSALNNSRQKGAQAVAIVSGGELMLTSAKQEFDYIKLPGGMPTRLALGYIFVPLYRLFQYLGLIEEGDSELRETKEFLADQRDLFRNTTDNEALQLAEELNDTLPIFYSDSLLMRPVNLWWQYQFEQNAKTLTYGNFMPEMTHNEIVGWERIVHLTGRLSVVMLKDREDDERVQKRMSIVEELIRDQAASLHVLKSRGKSKLARLFSLMQLADWTSFYLAVKNNVDPTPVTKIDLLKSKLAES